MAERAARIRILSCSALEACLVAQGSTDAFADARSDTDRLVDLAAAVVRSPRPAVWWSTPWTAPSSWIPT